MNSFLYSVSMILCLFVDSTLSAQAKNDYVWILGYPTTPPEIYFGGTRIDFASNDIEISYFNSICSASEPGVICSNTGRLLAYSNSCNIYGSDHQVMENGDSINYGANWDIYCDIAYPGTQNNLILPFPGDTNKAIVFYLKVIDDFSSHLLMYSILEFSESYPKGIVTVKDKLLLDPGRSSLLTATKHGNGRDWWLVIPENNSNRFFNILIDPSGISVQDTQAIGAPWGTDEWGSQAVFTPDGSKYIRFNPWKGLDIFNFDRCLGQLVNILEIGQLSDPILAAGGVAVSADSRFLYVSNHVNLYQFDLFASDIKSSRLLVGEYDGYLDPFPTNFYHMMLAPDEKIYIFSTSTNKSIHVIKEPKMKGEECKLLQHFIHLPTHINNGSINVPYYRLGSMDESSCDTIGINNKPIAEFRYEIDSSIGSFIKLLNNSYFNPKTYRWTIENELYSELRDPPPFNYGNDDELEVCLIVSNDNGSNSKCRNIKPGEVTSVSVNLNLPAFYEIYPNPFDNTLYISSFSSGEAIVRIYSPLGINVFTEQIEIGTNELDLQKVNPGIYYLTISNSNYLKVNKVVVKN